MAAAPLPRTPWGIVLVRLLAAVGVVALVVWSVVGLQFDLTHFGSGALSAGDYLSRLFPHTRANWRDDRDYFHRDLVKPLCETVQMALFGTAVGALLAFPVSFLAARTGYVPRLFSGALKSVLNVLRSVPTFIYALVIVSAIGLGASAGAVTLAFVSFISLSKQCAEMLESVSVGPIEAVRAAGGNTAQVFVFGMMPQVFPLYLSITLYTLEYNVKDAFVVGFVGAGGLGADLLTSLRLYQHLHSGVVILLMILLVNLVDYVSYRVRLVFS